MESVAKSAAPIDTVWGAVVSGAYASAATALLFLVIDSVRGEPLQTASTLGSVVLLGQDPGATAPFRLDMVALYSLVHLAAFVLIGAAVTLAYQHWERIRSPGALVGLVTLGLTAGAGLVDALFFPGLVSAIGPLALVAGNLAAALAMAWVLDSGLATATSEARVR